MRDFVISDPAGRAPVVCGEDELLLLIGELLFRVSQLDPGDKIVISCYNPDEC